MLIETLEAGKDEAKKALTLYGPVFSTTDPVTVTICGTFKNAGKQTAYAGATAFLGLILASTSLLEYGGVRTTYALTWLHYYSLFK